MTATEQARSTAQEGAQQVRERAQEGAQKARGRVSDEVDRRSTQAGEQMSGTAQAIRETSSKLREQGNEQGARAVEQAASRIESAGSWLRESDGDRILSDVEDFGRRNPLAVMAGGLAIGFALSRLLKASSRGRYQSSQSGNGTAALPRAGATTPATTGPTMPVTPDPTTTGPGTVTPDAGAQGARPPAWQGGLGGEGEGTRPTGP
jgi:hypothetical protein